MHDTVVAAEPAARRCLASERVDSSTVRQHSGRDFLAVGMVYASSSCSIDEVFVMAIHIWKGV